MNVIEEKEVTAIRVTLQDVATRMGVTPSTVQRALSGAAGVSLAKREQIQRVAEEMGYRRNVFASSLKRGTKRIAVVLPDLDGYNRYTGPYLWKGIDQYMEGDSAQWCELVRLTYTISPEEQNSQLQDVLQGVHGAIDGVITRGSRHLQTVEILRGISDADIPLILVGSDASESGRMTCINTHAEMAGRMAADLLLGFGSLRPNDSLIVAGNFSGTDQYQNALGFEKQIWASGMPLEVSKVHCQSDTDIAKASFLKALSARSNIVAIYATNARITPSMCAAIDEQNMVDRVRTIGSDVFAESATLMEGGKLNAIIHNRFQSMANHAMRAMMSFLSNDELPEPLILMDPVIVTKGSLEYYQKML